MAGPGGPEARLRAFAALGRRGEAAAYRAMLLELSLYLRGYYAARSPAAPADRERMVQDALRLVHAKRATLDSGPFAPWAHAIARRVLVAHAGDRAADDDEPAGSLFATALPEPSCPPTRPQRPPPASRLEFASSAAAPRDGRSLALRLP